MYNTHDTLIEEIAHRLLKIVEYYKTKKGMNTQDIRAYFLISSNFKKIIRLLGDLHQVYDEGKYIISFERRVYDLLFFGIVLMQRVPCEKCQDEEDDCDCDEDDEF